MELDGEARKRALLWITAYVFVVAMFYTDIQPRRLWQTECCRLFHSILRGVEYFTHIRNGGSGATLTEEEILHVPVWGSLLL